ncbi:hypothetical protein ACLKA6_010382 [Drosophila palustris]
MPRRKTAILIRKYLIIFFAILLIFIWLNHDRAKAETEKDDGMVHFPSVSITPTTRRISTGFLHRHERLRKLVPKNLWNRTHRIFERETPTDSKETTTNLEDFEFQRENREASTPMVKAARYFVNSKNCRMPYADPFSREALEIYTPFKLKLCSNDSDIFVLNYNWNKKHYMLHLNEKALYRLSSYSSVSCNFRQVIQGRNKSSEINSRIYFNQSYKLPRDLSGIFVECHDAKNSSRIVQQDAFPLVQTHNRTGSSSDKPPSRRQPSVILLGLNSLSRMNFQRTMPKTAKFVSQLGWFEMEGYNKVADNTVQNLLPVLMGCTAEQSPRRCKRDDKECVAQFPWIWKDYKRAGYTTALGEDLASSGIVFTQDGLGYHPGEVDHSLHSLLLRMEQVMSIYVRFGYNYCIGRRLAVSYVYAFCEQFVSRYVEELDQPAFGYFWSCTFTRDYNFGAASLDDRYLGYLQQLEAHQLFDKAIVILFSDHGARFGELLDLSDSFLEERLPMLHIYLPPWFRTSYPKYVQALYLNRNRLSSNFDLHNTLRHILQLNATTQADLPPLATCPSSQSLLHPLPRDRSCEDACIGEHWCTCKEFIAQGLNTEMYLLAKRVIYHINRWMLVHQFNTFCQRMRLLNLDSAEKKMLFEDNGKETMHGGIAIYRLRFRTLPGSAKFQATVRLNRDLKKFDNSYVPEISRLNSYHNHSLCVDDVIAKKFCFCYPSTKLDTFMGAWKKLKLTTLPG